MKERIVSITEVTNIDKYDSYEYDGYEIVTTEQTIFIGIDNYQQCCESWGYLVLNDPTDYYIGAEFLGVELVDPDYNKLPLTLSELDSGDAAFVDIKTSRGVIQIAVYNVHNGYYSHKIIVRSRGLNTETLL